MRTASIDVAGTKLRKTSTPRRWSRLSYSFCVVSLVGTPSTNFSVPMRVCTVSGVMMASGIFWLKRGVGCAIAS
jgi:hypothetical protein